MGAWGGRDGREPRAIPLDQREQATAGPGGRCAVVLGGSPLTGPVGGVRAAPTAQAVAPVRGRARARPRPRERRADLISAPSNTGLAVALGRWRGSCVRRGVIDHPRRRPRRRVTDGSPGGLPRRPLRGHGGSWAAPRREDACAVTLAHGSRCALPAHRMNTSLQGQVGEFLYCGVHITASSGAPTHFLPD